AAEAGASGGARATDRVELVDEHDRRRGFLRLREEVAHPRGADANDRLDELRGGHREERSVRLAGDRPSEQRLASAWWTGQQHAVRNTATELLVLLWMPQEVDHFRQLRFRLLDPRDIRERDAVARRLIPARPGAAERPEPVLHAARPSQPA